MPTTSPAIMNRMQEISSNTSLIRKMRMIASYNKLIEQGKMGGGKRMLMHVIEAEEFIRAFPWSSKTQCRLGLPAASLQCGARPRKPVACSEFRSPRFRIDG